jgi:hypothetical protein
MMSLMVWARLVLSSATLYSVSSVTLYCRVAWHCSGASEWSIVLALHYSRTVAVCLHALQALTALSARMSCMSMMALISGAFETCTRVLEKCVPSCTGRPARLFFILEACGPQGAAVTS